MRVLHVHSGNLYGGIERVLVTLAHHQAEDFQHEFALCFSGRLEDDLVAAGAAVHLLGPVRLRNPWSLRRGRRALLDLCHRIDPHVSVVHGAWAWAVFGPTLSTATRTLVWLHTPLDGRSILERLARRNRPDLVIANSRFTAEHSRTPWPQKPLVLYSPYELRAAAPRSRTATRASLGANDNSFVILQVSRMEPWKGHEALLHALALMHEEQGWVCWIAGGPQRAEEIRYLERLESLARELGIRSRVRFLGERTDVADLLRAADALVQLNKKPEPFGLVFIEALQAGTPIVTARSGGAAEILDGCALLVDPQDPAKVRGALIQLRDDKAIASRLSSRSPRRASELCSPERQMDRLRELFQTRFGFER